MEYTVYATGSGAYSVQAYYATAAARAGANLLVNGVQQAVLNLPGTGSWGTLRMSAQSAITLPSGQSVVRIAAQPQFQPYNLAGLLVTPIAAPVVPAPAAWITNVNSVAATTFDITRSSNASGYTLDLGSPPLWGNLQPGGYVEYSISTAAAGSYGLQMYYSTTLSGGAAVLVGSQQQGTANLPSTGSWAAFTTSNPITLSLPAGPSILRVAALPYFEPFNLEGMSLAPVGLPAVKPPAPPATQPPGGAYPLAGQKFYVNPTSASANNINQSCSALYPNSAGLLSQSRGPASGSVVR